MKTKLFFIIFLLSILTLFQLRTFASGGHTFQMIPKGAKVRLGQLSATSFAFSRDGTRLAVVDPRIGIWLYDAHRGTELALLTGHTDLVTTVAFSPDGQTLASGSADRTIRLWDAHTYELREPPIEHTEIPRVLTFSPDGQMLVAAGGDSEILQLADKPDDERMKGFNSSIRIWDVGTGALKKTLTGKTGWITSLIFSSDGETLASGSADGTICIWTSVTGELNPLPSSIRISSHKTGVASLSFLQDNTRLLSSSVDGTVQLWQVESGKEIVKLKGTDSSTAVGFSRDGEVLASVCKDETVQVWDVQRGEQLTVLTGHAGYVNTAIFSPDMETLASGSVDKTVRLWDVRTGELRATLEGHAESVFSLLFSPDSSTLVSISNTSTEILLWEVRTGKLKGTPRRPSRYYGDYGGGFVEFAPDGKTIVSGHQTKIWLWDARTGKYRSTLTGHTNVVKAVAFSTDGKILASGSSDKTVRLWDIQTGTQLLTLEGHTDAVNAVAFSIDGKVFASGSSDKTVRLWNVNTRWDENQAFIQNKVTLNGHEDPVRAVKFSTDGKMIAGATWNKIHLWDTHTGNQIAILDGHPRGLSSFAFAPDGRTLASSGEEGDPIIYFWDAHTGKQKDILLGHIGHVSSLAFSPDSRLLASGDGYYDGENVLLWDTTTREIRATLPGHTNGVRSLAFSPDGVLLACGGRHDILVWDVHFLQRKAVFNEPIALSLAFSSDSTRLASNSRTVLLWEPISTVDRDVVVKINPFQIKSPLIGKQLRFNIEIVGAKNVVGYQLTVAFDETALRYVSSTKGDYLSSNAFFAQPIVEKNQVTLASTAPTGADGSNGVLATLTLEVIDVEPSPLRLTNMILCDTEGKRSRPSIEREQVETK